LRFGSLRLSSSVTFHPLILARHLTHHKRTSSETPEYRRMCAYPEERRQGGLPETKAERGDDSALLGNGLDKALKRCFSKFIHS